MVAYSNLCAVSGLQDKELFARLLKSVFMLSDSGYDDQESGSIVSLALAMSNPYPHEVVKVESAMAMLASRHHLSITADWITVARAVYQYAYSAPGELLCKAGYGLHQDN